MTNLTKFVRKYHVQVQNNNWEWVRLVKLSARAVGMGLNQRSCTHFYS